MKRPNILIMLPHDLGDFLGCYGHRTVHSPNLDNLARLGVRFDHCYATAPECTPSRGSMMTGLQPHQNGLMGLSNFGWSLKAPHMAQRMGDHGYATHLFGFQHETHEAPQTLGYQHLHPAKDHTAPRVCQALSQFIRESQTDQDTPWFAHAGFFHVHRVWAALCESRFDWQQIDVPAFLPDRPVVRKDLARLHEDIAVMDEAIGSVLMTLEQTGQDRNTLILFVTDHGAAFPGAKATLYDAGVRIAMLMHWPGVIEGGLVYDELISNTDILPTLLELIGGKQPEGLDGRSFLPLLRGAAYEPRDQVTGGLFYDVAYDPMHYVRTRTHKYIRSFAVTCEDAGGADPQTLSTFEAGRWIRVDDFDVLTSPTWQALAEETDRSRPPREELYDLRSDPCERHNLAEDPASRDVLDAMRRRLDQAMRATQSPLLEGHVPPPPAQRQAFANFKPHTPRYAETVKMRKSKL